MSPRTGFVARRIVTSAARYATPDNRLGVLTSAAVVIEGGRVVWLGPAHEAPKDAALVDVGDRLITPGLVDAHTHAAWVGSRHTEYAMRMQGLDYASIARAGGGIAASAKAIAEANSGDIEQDLAARLARMAQLGVTTVEVKSGYGLTADGELKQLRAIASVARDAQTPRVVPTFLGLHALPAGFAERRQEYVHYAANELLPTVAREKLARFVDAYVDVNAFSVDEARILFGAAKRFSLSIRVHAGQFGDVGAVELSAELGARTADHLEHVSEGAIASMKHAGMMPTLLPIASFTLDQAPPPVQAFRDAGLPMIVASDANPGTAPSESLPLALALAVRSYRLTYEEALLGATRYAAQSLSTGQPDDATGTLEPGAPADLVVWDVPHEICIVQPWGVPRTVHVLREGRSLYSL